MDDKLRAIHYLKCSKIYVKLRVLFGLNEEFFFFILYECLFSYCVFNGFLQIQTFFALA